MRHRRENSHRKRNNKHTFADDDRCTYRTFPKYRAATARRTVLYRRAARNRAVLCGMGVRRYGGAASDGSCRTGRHLALFGIAVPFHLSAPDTLPYRLRAAYQPAWGAVPEDGLHGAIPHRGLCGTPKPHATALRIEDGTHLLDGQEYTPA